MTTETRLPLTYDEALKAMGYDLSLRIDFSNNAMWPAVQLFAAHMTRGPVDGESIARRWWYLALEYCPGNMPFLFRQWIAKGRQHVEQVFGAARRKQGLTTEQIEAINAIEREAFSSNYLALEPTTP